MSIWEFIKDIARYLDWDMAEPREISSGLEDYLKSQGIDQAELAEFRWVSRKNIWKKVESPDAKLEKFIEKDKLRRRKREVVKLNHAGEIDSYLCRRRQ